MTDKEIIEDLRVELENELWESMECEMRFYLTAEIRLEVRETAFEELTEKLGPEARERVLDALEGYDRRDILRLEKRGKLREDLLWKLWETYQLNFRSEYRHEIRESVKGEMINALPPDLRAMVVALQ